MIGICIIATRKYKQFAAPLIEQIGKYFLPEQEKGIVLFQDGIRLASRTMPPIMHVDISPLKFPYASLYRYRLFSREEHFLKNFSHIFYIDADMGIENIVGEEILGDGLTVVRHPGFYINGGYGSPNTVKESKAYVPPEGRDKYFAGGFNGGRSDVFLEMSKTLAENIDDDESRGVMAEYHDESHLNWYLYNHPEIPKIELTPSYCMPEQPEYKESWGLGHLRSIILALSKNHNEIRS